MVHPQLASMLRQQLKQTLTRLTDAYYRHQIEAIRIDCGPGSCEECRAACGEYHPLRVPRLPHANCSHDLGCRCAYKPIAR
ncbi:MAG: hypothetical protein WEB00_11080 [Dehalococcoidia bacterium]